jgi:ADP-heptose:LPS heptosyltransferase
MAPLWENLDASFYAPFLGAALDQTEGTPVQRLDSHIKDFADTAAILKQLEALVTVDTAAAHLAGALGVKTFLLLSSIPDWRWGTEGTKTLWYENTTLVRAASFGDWREAVDVALRKLRE